MAISSVSDGTDAGAPLLEDAVEGYVDCRGRPVYKSSSGGWRSAYFIIVVEIAERFAYYGIASNLITYLTGPLGQSTVKAAENVNVWLGATSLLPVLGAIVADSFLGRYRTIVVASLIYVLGLGLLTLSTTFSSSNDPSDCQKKTDKIASCGSPDQCQVILFFFSLYLVALGQSGHKPCVQAFGADQFDEEDPEECKLKSSFFNWWSFGISVGAFSTRLVLNYIQDNLSWGLGFGIPCIFMAAALVVFLLGTKTYRYCSKTDDQKSPFGRIGRVFVAAIRNWQTKPSAIVLLEEQGYETLAHQSHHEQFKFLNKALLVPDGSKTVMCSISDVEDAKALLKLVPIWTTSLVYGIVYAQSSTFFTKQGATMDRSVSPGFDMPAASLQCFINLAIILAMPVYDRVFVPIARASTGKPAGITMLQRIGIGIILCAISMVIAALVETKRLETAEEYGLVDKPKEMIPMSFWWLVPQYVIFGLADVFTFVGLQEFFYDQAPKQLRSVGISLFLSVLGVGSLLSSYLISTIDGITSANGGVSWFDNNLNQAHLDYFYWLLAGLTAFMFTAYLYFAKSYIYKR
ncbi:hypothetical protein ACOSQ2_009566 [Xanthoceras sorbifolium]|uniref:Protein NRT1/ PTR FAMILY 5.10-like n=1 Tax=Xanthoceras sorbifolium TaxID=99658 RepID=A0ABQ8HV52_9ROSI|nr:hypothetical protein JRO89_XS07G0264700 [Xanthoceras sorbifolium]